MYFDLNIPYNPSGRDRTAERLALITARFSQLTESVIALNRIVAVEEINNVGSIKLTPVSVINHPVKQLTRITVETDNGMDNINFDALRSCYQLVALRTTDEQTFREACRSPHIDIIALDCTKRLCFRVNQADVQEAMKRGIMFEICYSPGIRDTTLRTYLLQIAKEIINNTKGHNIIVSSEALDVSDIRAPFDVMYLLKALGLPNDKAKFATSSNCEKLLNKIKRRS